MQNSLHSLAPFFLPSSQIDPHLQSSFEKFRDGQPGQARGENALGGCKCWNNIYSTGSGLAKGKGRSHFASTASEVDSGRKERQEIVKTYIYLTRRKW